MKKFRKRFLVIFMIGFINLGIQPLQASQFDKIAVACAALGTSFLIYENTSNFMYPQENNIDMIQYPEFAKFVKKYRCSPKIERQIHKHENNKTSTYGHPLVQEYRSIPFYNKGNSIDRIINAERTKKVIESHQLDSIGVPDKCLCHMYGNVWNVVAKKVNRSRDRSKISLREAEQLKIIAEEIFYSDFHNGNIVRNDQNKLMIIDTEDRSFASEAFDVNRISLFFSCFLRDNAEKDVLERMKNQKIIKKNDQSNDISNPSQDVLVDDVDIDFEKMKREFLSLQDAEFKEQP